MGGEPQDAAAVLVLVLVLGLGLGHWGAGSGMNETATRQALDSMSRTVR